MNLSSNRKQKIKRRETSVLSTTILKSSKEHGLKKVNQYKILSTLGKGGYATVKLCAHIRTDDQYAMKSMSKKFLKSKFPAGKTQSAYDYVKDELKVLQRLEHPNIIYLHEIIDDPNRDHIYLITEYHSRGSLADRLDEKNKIFNRHNQLCIRENRP